MPKEKRQSIERESEILSFLEQSHISEKNVTRLKTLASSEEKKIAELANIVLEVAQIKVYKRGRLKGLAKERRDLLQILEETGLIMAHHMWKQV